MKVHYPKLCNMAHLLALNVLLLPRDLTIIFYLQGVLTCTFNICFEQILEKNQTFSIDFFFNFYNLGSIFLSHVRVFVIRESFVVLRLRVI